MSDELFLLLTLFLFPYVSINGKDGKPRFIIWGALFHLLDYIAEAVRATFGGRANK